MKAFEGKYLVTRDQRGAVVTVADLPVPNLKIRWTNKLKGIVVAAQLGELISLEEIEMRYGVNREEFAEWLRAYQSGLSRPLAVDGMSRSRQSDAWKETLIPSECVQLGQYVYYSKRMMLACGDKRVRLSDRENRILNLLLSASGNVVDYNALFQVMGIQGKKYSRSELSMSIKCLRDKFALLARKPNR